MKFEHVKEEQGPTPPHEHRVSKTLSRALQNAWDEGCCCPGPEVKLTEVKAGEFTATIIHRPFCFLGKAL